MRPPNSHGTPPGRSATGRSAADAGFTLIEVIIAAVVMAVAAMAAVLHITRSTQHTGWVKEKVFAEQKALSILNELRGHVIATPGVVAGDLAQFDDGVGLNPVLTILRDPLDPTAYVAPDHPVSGNDRVQGVWHWYRQVIVAPFGAAAETLDKRLCTVRIYRRGPSEAPPGTRMAEISGLIQTVTDPVITHQVYDLYVIALENHPGWWVDVDARYAAVSGALLTIGLRNPGLRFRVHWITKAGFGRHEEYAPFVNEQNDTTAPLDVAYVYPGRLPSVPAGLPGRLYNASGIDARLNATGRADDSTFQGGYLAAESFTDLNGNSAWDEGEPIVDTNGNGVWDAGNPAPYALADQHNHCMRWPEAVARFEARVAAGRDHEDEPTWRLLLDRMATDPSRYHNAMILNLHGEVLPMPPVRNVSDAAKAPLLFPGWRVVAHPERLHAVRVPGDDALSTAPRFRVHAWKASFESADELMTQEEPYVDADGDGIRGFGETYADWNGNGEWDTGVPLSFVIPGGDFTWNPNGGIDPSIVVRRLSGGVDGDGDGTPERYADWTHAPRYPEDYTDANGNGLHDVLEPYFDLDGNGIKDPDDPHRELDGSGTWTNSTEPLQDENGNGRHDLDRPAEVYTDTNGNGRWDAAEPWWDRDGDGAWTAPGTPVLPWVPWNPADYGDAAATAAYEAAYGEPFLDLDGDGVFDAAEPLEDGNLNGVWDGGFRRGEMWYALAYDAAAGHTLLSLHGTPLETPQDPDGRGLHTGARLYDMDYIPCPTPATSGGLDRFERDLFTVGDFPKNTARWTVELPTRAVRRGFESAPGGNDGDAFDRLVTVETRITDDVATGTLWPIRNSPDNRSATHVYFHATAATIPFSERYQYLGDPRHSPYADTDRAGATFAHGYNWFFDDFKTSGDNQAAWLAFDPARLRAGWLGRADADVPRFLAWLRTAMTTSEAFFATAPGFSFRYLSLGGDVGLPPGAPVSGVPMDGAPFGSGADVEENTLLLAGTAGIGGSRKYLRTQAGGDAGLRVGGHWWSKPWLGELAPDAAYLAQWSRGGNLESSEHRLVRRDAVAAAQQPPGTRLLAARGELGDEGCTAFFNLGSSGSTFHHTQLGVVGQPLLDGADFLSAYGFEVPAAPWIAAPFNLTWGGDGGTGPEFAFPLDYPRHTASLASRFVAVDSGAASGQGSALVRLEAPFAAGAARIIVNGMDPTTDSGVPFFSQLVPLTLLHSFFAEGVTGSPYRVEQLPRLRITQPTTARPLPDPVSITLQWETKWRRWDGEKYTVDYADGFAESEGGLAYLLLYSDDGGQSWRNMMDDSAATPGVLPMAGPAPDPARTRLDLSSGGLESWTWPTPTAKFPGGPYLLRIEAHRRGEALHHAYHEERVYVER